MSLKTFAKRRIRRLAVRRVRRDLILNGRDEHKMTEEELEYLLSDAENQVVMDLQKTGLIALAAGFGLSL